MKLEGLFTALITPFKENGEVDTAGLKKNIAEQIRAGVDGLVLLGTTGEAPTLSFEEKKAIIQAAKEEINRRVPLIIGTGTNCTKTTIGWTVLAKETGCDAALVITPYYNKPTQSGIVRHFEAIAKETDLPLIAYNHPGRTGTFIEPSTLFKLASIPSVIGLKEASSDLKLVKRLIEKLPKDFKLLSGCDTLTYPMMEYGASGVISVVSNIQPARMQQMVHLALEKKWEEARSIHHELLPLMELLELETNPIPVKAAMNLLKKPAGLPRLPLTELSLPAYEKLRQYFDEKVSV